MRRLRFFVAYALKHLGRERQRTAFVLFCIAAGVAAVVAMRSLGLMIDDSLTANLQAANGGDLVIEVNTAPAEGDVVDESLFQKGSFRTFVSAVGQAEVENWAAGRDFELLPAVQGGDFPMPVRLFPVAEPEAMALIVPHFVDPARYPFYGEVTLVEPVGQRLAEALATPDSAVVSKSLAERNGLAIGDTFYLDGAAVPFKITAVVADENEANMGAMIFTYLYLSYQSGVEQFGLRADTFYVQTPPGADVSAAAADFEMAFPGFSVTTTADLAEQNGQTGELINRLVTMMGLVSLLIGGIGIVNTMTVVVNRRVGEIGVLKSVGVQGTQIIYLFLVEAALLGLLGSLLGIVFGLLLTFALQGWGQELAGVTLAFAVYTEALAMGLVLGLIVTLAFGCLPIIAAGRVRPEVVLQSEGGVVPANGRRQALAVIAGLTAVLGLLAGYILGSFLNGVILAFGVLIVLGLLLGILSVGLAIFSRLPSFGSISFKLVQRAIDARRGRTAGTLLALIVGMFALSLVLLTVRGLLKDFAEISAGQLGGDILVMPGSPAADEVLADRVPGLTAVTGYEHDTIYRAGIVAVNGNDDMAALLAEAVRRGQAEQAAQGIETLATPAETLVEAYLRDFSLKLRSETNDNYTLTAGQDIAAAADPALVLQENEALRWLALKPEDRLTLRFCRQDEPAVCFDRQVRVAGLHARPNSGVLNITAIRATDAVASVTVPPDDIDPIPSLYVLQVAEGRVAATALDLSQVPDAFILETAQLQLFATRIISRLAPLPLLVASLALFAGVVIIANTMALAALERRRQIGIMKAIGLQTGRVLQLLLLESGLVGLLGGVIGAGLSSVFILAAGVLGDGSGNFPVWTLVGLVGTAVAMALLATLVSAYQAAREKPLVVLRYE